MAEIPLPPPLAVVDKCVHYAARTCRTQPAKNAFAPSRRHTTAARKASSSVRTFHPSSPHDPTSRAPHSPHILLFSLLGSFGAVLGVRCDTIIVYDVSSRESFEALPRWLEELENYVPPEVVKIVVGNKLDKVKQTITRPLHPSNHSLSDPDPFLLATRSPFLGILPPGANVRSGGVRRARGMSLCRGIRQDGRRRDRGFQRRRHAHHRYALAMERGQAHQDQYRRGATARWKCHDHRCSREHAGEHRPVTGAGRGGVERLFVLAARFCCSPRIHTVRGRFFALP